MPRVAIQDMKSSLKFEGDALDRRIQIGTPPAIGASSNFTVGCWVNLSPRTGNHTIYNGNFSFANNLGYLFRVGGSNGNVSVFYGNTAANSSSGIFQYNNWNFIVYEMISTSVNVYINNMTTPATTLSVTRIADFGTPIGYFAQEFNGAASGNRILGTIRSCFNTASTLTAAQKQAIMDNSSIPTLTGGVFYHTNEGAGSILYDASGNGNNATLTNGTWVLDTPTKIRKEVNGNLVYNGDFEYAPVVNVANTTIARFLDGTATGTTANNIFGWAQWASSTGAKSSVQFDNTVYKTGRYSLKVSTTATGANAIAGSSRDIPSTADLRSYAIPVLPNTSYTHSCWMKTNLTSGSAATGAGLRTTEYDANGGTSVTNPASQITTTTDWTFYTQTFTTASTTRFIVVRPAVIGADGAATLIMDAWYDNIELRPTTATTRTQITGPFRQPVNNLVRNGDFEYAPAFTAATTTDNVWINGTAGGSATDNQYSWVTASPAGTRSAQFDTSVKRNGTASMKLTISANSAIQTSNYRTTSAAIVKANALPVLGSTSYTVSGFIKTDWISGSASRGAYVRYAQFDGDGNSLGSVDCGYFTTTTDWTPITGSTVFITNANCRFIVVSCNAHSTTGATTLNGSAWFDDIRLDLTAGTTRTAVT